MSVPEEINLERVWNNIAAEVWATEPGRIERFAARLLQSPGLARALVTTPSLVISWLLASVAVLAVGVVATAGGEINWVSLLAPALAGVAIAFAYGPGVDPAFELSQTMAISDRMILLVRATTIFAVNALLGIAASLVTATTTDLTFRWLIPMTAVSALGLAIATTTRSSIVGVTGTITLWATWILANAYPDWAEGTTGSSSALNNAVSSNALLPVYVVGTLLLVGVALYATRITRMENP